VEEHISPDGRLRFYIHTGEDGDVTLGFAYFQWHTHADTLAATTGLSEDEAVRQFVNDIISGKSVICLWSVGDNLEDVWVSEDPERDYRYPQPGETVELRYWDGRKWSP
jgi:hypothetical protein